MSLVDMMVKMDSEGKRIMADHEIEDEAMTSECRFSGPDQTNQAISAVCRHRDYCQRPGMGESVAGVARSPAHNLCSGASS